MKDEPVKLEVIEQELIAIATKYNMQFQYSVGTAEFGKKLVITFVLKTNLKNDNN